MNEDQKQLSIHRMEKAANKMRAASLCYREQLFLEAGSNLYYSILNCARALLAAVGKDSKSHNGVVHLLNENFIRTGVLQEKYGRIFAKALTVRIKSDYNDFYIMEKELIAEMVIETKEFYAEIKRILTDNYYLQIKD